MATLAQGEYCSLDRFEVSVVGLGCNNFGMRLDGDATARVVDAAIDFFDTAESYGNGASEELLGRALSGRRDDVVIATKWGHTRSLGESERGGDPRLIRERLDVSLARLGTDYVDHYRLHRPDPLTPVDETLGCLTGLRAAGKIRECGATRFTADGLRGAHAAATTHDLDPFPSVQNHYSLLTRAPEHDGVFAACEELDIAFVPYFALESGLLTGKYRLGADRPEGSRLANWGDRASLFIDDDKLAVVDRLIAWCESRDHTLLDLAMSRHTSHPLVASVISGATDPEPVVANVAASDWALTPSDRAEVEQIVVGPSK